MRRTRREFMTTSGVTLGLVAGPEPGPAQARPAAAMPTERARNLMATFGLKYPIFEAPHGNTTSPELAAAVSGAGAMGALALSILSPDAARTVVTKVRSATKAPFFINYVLASSSGKEPTSLRAALTAGAPIVQFSWGFPGKETVSVIREAGAKLGMQVTSVETARAALDLGADYLVCQGTEAGGHVQATRGLYEVLPMILEEAKQKPVVASGGIGNGAGVRRALLAGASGAMLGTRFVATVESNAHPAYKQALIAAQAGDTALTICFQDGWPAMHRALRNRTLVMWDSAGCPSPGTRPGEGDVVATGPNGRKIFRYWALPPSQEFQGAPEEMPMMAGLGVEFVKDLPAGRELVQRIWRECETTR